MVVALRNLSPVEPLPPRSRRGLRCPHCDGLVMVYRTPSKPGVCILCRQRYQASGGQQP